MMKDVGEKLDKRWDHTMGTVISDFIFRLSDLSCQIGKNHFGKE